MTNETLEEAAEHNYPNGDIWTEEQAVIRRLAFKNGAKWQAERSQKIVPSDAYNIEVFAIKPDENGQLFAYIGYKISNGNFEFNVVPFTEPQERMYSDEEVKHIVSEALQSALVTVDLEQWFKQFKKK
jgi:hypothetical protein